MNILITGASGFAAEHLIPILRKGNIQVIGTDRKQNPSAAVDKYVQTDLLEINLRTEDFPDLDMIIHLAAARADWGISDDEFFRDNFEATKALLEFAKTKRCSAMLFVSSIAVMPQNIGTKLTEQSPNDPINAYGRSKELSENLLIDNCKSDPNFALTIVRPTVLFGPSNPENTGIYRATDNNIYRLINSIHNGRFAFIGSENTIKSMAYVKNFCAAIIFLMSFKPGYQIFIYCDEPSINTGTLVRYIRNVFGKKGLGPKFPLFIATRMAGLFDWLGPKINYNFPITKARIETFNRSTDCSSDKLANLGFKQPYNITDALDETIKWYLALKDSKPK